MPVDLPVAASPLRGNPNPAEVWNPIGRNAAKSTWPPAHKRRRRQYVCTVENLSAAIVLTAIDKLFF